MSDQRILLVGDSRVRRMQTAPSRSFPLHNVDIVVENGIAILDLIDRVNENLRDEHRVLILIAFYGDATCVVKQPIPGDLFASLVKGQPDHPATRVLELAAVAHAAWQSTRSDRVIIWTLPYYVDLVCYNCYRLRSPLPEDVYEMSLGASQQFVHFVDQLRSKWKQLMPANAVYRHLNEVLFHGDTHKHFKSFRFLSKFFSFPDGYLSDGLHPAPLFCEKIWQYLGRTTKCVPALHSREIICGPSTSSSAIVELPPLVARLSIKDRLWPASAAQGGTSRFQPKWKWRGKGRGKGRGKSPRVTPYVAPCPVVQPSNAALSVIHPPASMQSFYSGFPPALVAPAPSLPYAGSSRQSSAALVEEEDTDRYGNVSWRALPPAAASPLGHVNFSIPHEWSWAAHIKEIKRVQGQCITASLAHQTMARTQACNMIRERGLEEMRTGLNASFNASATTYGHRLMYGVSYPVAQHQHAELDLRALLPPTVPVTPNQSMPYPPASGSSTYSAPAP